MDSTKRKVSHNYNLRSKSRRARIQSQRNDDDASSSSNNQEASNGHSENTTQQQHSREHPRRKRSISQRSSPVSGNSSHSPASKRSKDASDDIKCVICLDTVNDRQMKFIRCGHGFHKKCCNNWLSVNDACPVCRTVVGRRRRNTITLQDLNRIDDTPISDIIYFFTLSVFRT